MHERLPQRRSTTEGRGRGPCWWHRRRAFTLLEVVLAVGLSAVVMYLIATAIQLYLFRVDTSRGEVESAQLARILLEQMSRDISAARRRDPEAAPTSGGASSTDAVAADQASSDGPSSEMTSSLSSTGTLAVGLFGDATELRVDRAAPAAAWQTTLGDALAEAGQPQAPPVPTSVRYYFLDGTRMSSSDRAGLGLAAPDEDVAGLYVQTAPTAELVEYAESSDNPWDRIDDAPTLLAPEVVGLEFAYFDGTQLVESWDVTEQQGMPRAVEIRLQLYEPPRSLHETDEDDALPSDRVNSEWVREYRRLVWIPSVGPTESATLLALPRQATTESGPGNQNAGNGESADAN